MSFCRWLGIMVEGDESFYAMAQRAREGSTFEILVSPPISFFALSFFSPSSFIQA
jgi:hypothetical protein